MRLLCRQSLPGPSFMGAFSISLALRLEKNFQVLRELCGVSLSHLNLTRVSYQYTRTSLVSSAISVWTVLSTACIILAGEWSLATTNRLHIHILEAATKYAAQPGRVSNVDLGRDESRFGSGCGGVEACSYTNTGRRQGWQRDSYNMRHEENTIPVLPLVDQPVPRTGLILPENARSSHPPPHLRTDGGQMRPVAPRLC
ncbi:hypothetical protein NEOLEDRAFT_433587 [Neolentinus lepideus HHB14362 ss-1]|uniref:Uncharacterized protein n=1 Tax=Neolentinus lepideus HHB14362 ss-1 TaxID=1314782 RepID=A0A165RVC9_9AGAM|nr:hypothetical protein NEOLEDRAFT_433587 [Neolentinus lepideus HHB14362 ss-1]